MVSVMSMEKVSAVPEMGKGRFSILRSQLKIGRGRRGDPRFRENWGMSRLSPYFPTVSDLQKTADETIDYNAKTKELKREEKPQ